MRYKPCDQFSVDLFRSGNDYGLTLNPQVAERLLEEMSGNFGRSGFYKPARNFTLDRAVEKEWIIDEERSAYKDFIDRFFLRRARAALGRPEPPDGP